MKPDDSTELRPDAAELPSRSQCRREESIRDTELWREAGELLSRSRWWQEERVREELLRLEWHRPHSDEPR